jgi:rRNA-processing protein FCF1
LGRGTARGGPLPQAGILASIRAAIPMTVRVELVFDGIDDVGLGRVGTSARAAQNLFVEHTGRRSADRALEAAVEAQLRADGPAGTWGILVVTDDRELRGLVQAKGARVAGTSWLASRLARAAAGVGASRATSGTSIGHRRPPRPRTE